MESTTSTSSTVGGDHRGDHRGGGMIAAATSRDRIQSRGQRAPNTRRRGPSNSSDRPRPHHNNRGPHRGGGGDYSMPQPMRILTKSNDRPLVTPGSISIMQRETPSTGTDTSTVHSPSDNPTIYNHYNAADNNGMGGAKRITRRPTDGISSSASSFTPLQPNSTNNNSVGSNKSTSRIDRERGEGSAFTRVESAGFSSTIPNDTVCMKLINKSLLWDEKISEYFMDQSDFLVVGVLGKQGVGKSTIMSLLAGTRTGSGRPYLFKTQPKDVQESGGFTTAGVDIAITSERVILLDTQSILSGTVHDGHINEGCVPPGTTRESYSDVLSLQLAIFLFTVCHVVIVVMESGDFDIILRFLWIAEKLKTSCCNEHTHDINDGPTPPEFFPQIVFVLNHATPDDYQPAALKELHSLLSENFSGAKVSVAGGVSLARSGLVPVGKLIPHDQREWAGSVKPNTELHECNINLHLLPTNINPQDNFGSHCVEKYDREDAGLNPILSLIPLYQGHPSFQLLAETFRNQIFMMPRPSLCPTHNSTVSSQPQPMFEKGWYDYAHRSWLNLIKSNLALEHKKLIREVSQR